MPIDLFTNLLVEELEYTSLDEDTGWIFGFSFWPGTYGWEPVGCAEASATGVDPADIHYTDSTVGMPTLARSDTDPADPSFLMVNVPATTSGLTIDLETTNGQTAYTIPAVFENTLTFAFVLFGGESNPDGCEQARDGPGPGRRRPGRELRAVGYFHTCIRTWDERFLIGQSTGHAIIGTFARTRSSTMGG